MSKDDLMAGVESRANSARVEMHAVFKRAGVGPTILYRWRRTRKAPTMPTIGRLEAAMTAIELEKADA